MFEKKSKVFNTKKYLIQNQLFKIPLKLIYAESIKKVIQCLKKYYKSIIIIKVLFEYFYSNTLQDCYYYMSTDLLYGRLNGP